MISSFVNYHLSRRGICWVVKWIAHKTTLSSGTTIYLPWRLIKTHRNQILCARRVSGITIIRYAQNKIILKSLRARKPKGLNRIVEIGWGHICVREILVSEDRCLTNAHEHIQLVFFNSKLYQWLRSLNPFRKSVYVSSFTFCSLTGVIFHAILSNFKVTFPDSGFRVMKFWPFGLHIS